MSMRKLVHTAPAFGMISGKTFSSATFFWDTLYLPSLYKTSSLIKASRSKNNIYSFYVQNAVGVTIENWTNQKLEFPEDFISEGARDMWYKPLEVTHTFYYTFINISLYIYIIFMISYGTIL